MSFQNEIIIQSINRRLSRGQVIDALAAKYSDRSFSWANQRMKKFESTYGHMGIFGGTRKQNPINTKMINNQSIAEYLEDYSLNKQELLDIHNRITDDYDAKPGKNSNSQDGRKEIVKLVDEYLGENYF